MNFFEQFNIRAPGIPDLLDILIIWFIIYSLLRFLQGSRAMQMVVGLAVLFVIKFAAELFHLKVVSKSIGELFAIIPIAVLVLFQTEIRKVLASLVSNPFLLTDHETDYHLRQIFKAVEVLSQSRTGALLVFERSQSLKSFGETGVALDAIPSQPLIHDIFQTKSNLHDGAVIISNDRLAYAGCLLPLSQNNQLPKRFGTRHRAGIGLTEETDSLVVIVSEETGRVTFALDGDFYNPETISEDAIIKMYRYLTRSEETQKVTLLQRLLGRLKHAKNPS